MMLPIYIRDYSKVIVWDFEFATIGGEVKPTSLAYKNILEPNSKVEFIWLRDADNNVLKDVTWPFDEDERTLFVSFFGEAEYQCVIELGWDLEKWEQDHLDLFYEIRCLKNGLWNKFSLEDTAAKLGLKSEYLPTDKTNLRERLGKDEVTWEERATVERYNAEDVRVTENLFFYIIHHFQESENEDVFWQALNRGRMSQIAAKVSRAGYPVDVVGWDKFLANWDKTIDKILEKANTETDCFPIKDGKRKFSSKDFARLVESLNIPSWPRTDTGNYKTDKETLRRFERFPEIKMIMEAMSFKNSTKLKDLPIDRRDNRSKTYMSPFGTKTGRANPSTARHLPNLPPCLRPFMRAEYDKPIVAIDFEQQEFAVAATLSKDDVMLETYKQSDPYVYLGYLANVLPITATKKHPKRQMYKTVCLMTLFGAGVKTMAIDMGEPIEVAEKALQDHQRMFHKFWNWQQEYIDRFMLDGYARLKDGWEMRIPEGSTFRKFGEHKGYSENTLKNFPIQGTAASILYESLRSIDDAGYRVIGTMHDEIFVELDYTDRNWNEEHDIKEISRLMSQAAEDVMGTRIKTEHTILYPGMRLQPKDKKDLELFKFICKECGIDEKE